MKSKVIKEQRIRKEIKSIVKCWQLYVFLLPAVLYTIIFHYNV